MTGWDGQLDRFEANLADQRRALDEGRPQDVQAFEPSQIEPLPAELAERARALFAQADALTADLAAAVANVARQLQVVAVMKGSQQPSAAYVDRRG